MNIHRSLWVFLFLQLGTACAIAAGDAKPDTVAIFQAQRDDVAIKKITNLADQRIDYKIEICEVNDCDEFVTSASRSDSLTLLADYVYLYSVYEVGYPDFSSPLSSGGYKHLPFIEDAVNSGKAPKLLSQYANSLGCSLGKDADKCVLNKLGLEINVKQFKIKYDEGTRTETPVKSES